MSIPTFVDLQGFVFNKNFIVKEAAILRKGFIVSHYFFTCPVPWGVLIKSERRQVTWATFKHHGLQWEDGNIPYSRAQDLITAAIDVGVSDEEESSLIYVKGHEKRKWLADILDDAANDFIIETLDEHYEDVPTLKALDTTNSLRCNKHLKNCALQNVFKLYNWWLKNRNDSPHPFIE